MESRHWSLISSWLLGPHPGLAQRGKRCPELVRGRLPAFPLLKLAAVWGGGGVLCGKPSIVQGFSHT